MTKRLKWLAEPYCFGEAPFMPFWSKDEAMRIEIADCRRNRYTELKLSY